jgi:hypothetical protein
MSKTAIKQLKPEEIARLQALHDAWWLADESIVVRANAVEAEQEAIELEILDIVLGVRE